MREAPNPERDIRRRETAVEPGRDPRDVMAEVNEDFTRLRALGDELKKAADDLSAAGRRAVAQAAAEVRKRAARLDKNLIGLPRPEKGGARPPKEAAATDAARLGASLKALDETLTSFLTNPVFSDVGTTDPQLAVKARRDLDGLLALSEVVKKSAEKLAKQ